MSEHPITLDMPAPKVHTVAELAAKYLHDGRKTADEIMREMIETEGKGQQVYDDLVADLGGRLAAFDSLMRDFWPDFEPPCAFYAHRESVDAAMEAVEDGIRDQWSKVANDFVRLAAGR